MTSPLRPCLLVLHGNRLESLADAVLAWLANNPLGPLEPETLLVQSNGMAEWLKMALATQHGICAATRVELPARFIWRAYRAVLGRTAVPAQSPLDKGPLTWRLMRQLPALSAQPVFAPVAGFLGRGDAERRLQLAQRLADLLDQYQVYRSDWLQTWAQGHDVLTGSVGAPGLANPADDLVHPTGRQATPAGPPVPADQRWQPALWRAVLAELDPTDQASARPVLHQRFLAALAAAGPTPNTEHEASSPAHQQPATATRWPGLPRRIVLFGTTHIPHQTLEAIAALAPFCQVLLAVPNPCRFHWADLIDGRELLRAQRRRQPLRDGRDLAALPLQDLHAHGHPLLAAWGRQGRDFVRQLDAFDDVQAARAQFDIPRVDLFDDGPGDTLLQQIQAGIRELQPLDQQPRPALAADDRSVVFQLAHSPQREVEVLHDQLLQLLAHPPGGQPLAPRDIVVMVPDITPFAPAIRAVFGQHGRGDARHIPWGISDLRQRGQQPLLMALEALLKAPQQRFAASQLLGLLEVPALARRFGINPADLPTLAAWLDGAGIRWGLDATQRASLGLADCGDANTWAFGLQRLLLGYATGALPAWSADQDAHPERQFGGFAGIEPHDEVGGLDAALVGPLADLLALLQAWWRECQAPRAPVDWAERLRTLVADLFDASDDVERALLAALDTALASWLQACALAGFNEPVDLAVAREAWLQALDQPSVSQRFKAGGVTFCTLLPLRAIPFEVVCLLGMNEGDYPRRATPADFDLMALPGQARPGDRSRRDDDRQLLLDALLSARRVLSISWTGRSQRDNQAQPPSVLVAQLRDHIRAGWGQPLLDRLTTEHPLQPFSRRYFDGQGLVTYAREWRAAHVDPVSASAAAVVAATAVPSGPAAVPSPGVDQPAPITTPQPLHLTLASLADFLKNPVKAFFRQSLRVSFADSEASTADDESFAGNGLERWTWLDQVLREAQAQLGPAERDGHDRGSSPGAQPCSAGTTAAMPTTTQPAQRLVTVVNTLVNTQLPRLQRAGQLPLAAPGRAQRSELQQTLAPMLAHWQGLLQTLSLALPQQPLQLTDGDDPPGVLLDDWLDDLRADPQAPQLACWVSLQAGKLGDSKLKNARPEKLLLPWLRCLASAAIGQPAGGVLIGADAVLRLQPPPADAAQATLQHLLQAAHDGLLGPRPLPTAVQTGVASLKEGGDPALVYDGSPHHRGLAEGREPCLARLYPDFDSLQSEPGFAPASQRLYADFAHWLAHQVSIQPLPDSHAEAAAEDGDADD